MKLRVTGFTTSNINQNIIKCYTTYQNTTFYYKIKIYVPETDNPIYIPIIEDFNFSNIKILKLEGEGYVDVNTTYFLTKHDNKTKGIICYLDTGEYEILFSGSNFSDYYNLISLWYPYTNNTSLSNNKIKTLSTSYSDKNDILYSGTNGNTELNKCIKLIAIGDTSSVKETLISETIKESIVQSTSNDNKEMNLSKLMKRIIHLYDTSEINLSDIMKSIQRKEITSDLSNEINYQSIGRIEKNYEIFSMNPSINIINQDNKSCIDLFGKNVYFMNERSHSELSNTSDKSELITLNTKPSELPIIANINPLLMLFNSLDIFGKINDTIIQLIYTNITSDLINNQKGNIINQKINITINTYNYSVKNKFVEKKIELDDIYNSMLCELVHSSNLETLLSTKTINDKIFIYPYKEYKSNSKNIHINIRINIKELQSKTQTKV